MDKEIQFQGQYSKDILFKAIILVYQPSRWSAFLRIGPIVILVGIVFPSAWGLIDKQSSISFIDIGNLLGGGLALFGVSYLLLYPYFAPYFLASRLWKNPKAQEPLIGTISDEGITYTSSTASRHIRWEDFMRVWKREEFVALLTNDAKNTIFPRSFFKNEKDWLQFLQWVSSKVIEAK